MLISSSLFCPNCLQRFLNMNKSKAAVLFFASPSQYSTVTHAKLSPFGPLNGHQTLTSSLLNGQTSMNTGRSGQCLNRRSFKTWTDENHYTVLGVDNEASQEEIRSAYLKLSKDLHPDHNTGKSAEENDVIHNQFVKINMAYGIIGNKKKRRLYDLEILMHEDPRWKNPGTVSPKHGTSFRTTPMTFEERLQSMGLNKQDPDFYTKHGNYQNKVVLWCVLFIAVGVLVQGSAIMALYKRHAAVLDLTTASNTALLVEASNNAKKYSTVREQYESLKINPKNQISRAYGAPEVVPLDSVDLLDEKSA